MSDPSRTLSRVSPDSMPLELLDEIVDNLEDDQESLRQCSLVSRAWHPSAARRLFRRMQWPLCEYAWLQQMNGPPRCKCGFVQDYQRLQELKEILQSSYDIRTAVQELRITFSWSTPHAFTVPQHEPDASRRRHYPRRQKKTSAEELIDLLDLLPSLQSLHLCGLRFDETVQVSYNREAVRDLKRLEIASVEETLRGPTHMTAFLQHLRTITILVMHGLGSFGGETQQEPQENHDSSHRPRVDSLEVVAYHLSDPLRPILDDARAVFDFSHLSSFSVIDKWGHLSSELPSLSVPFFHGSAPGITSFTCNPSRAWVNHFSSLSVPPSLRALEVRLQRTCADAHLPDEKWQTIFDILATGPLRNVERLTVRLTLHRKHAGNHDLADPIEIRELLQSLDWTLLNRAVDKQLKSVRLYLALSVQFWCNDEVFEKESEHFPMMEQAVKEQVSAQVLDVLQIEGTTCRDSS